MVSQLFGAVVRAVLVVIVVLTPSLLLQGTTAENAQATMLLAFVLAGIVAWEYASPAPAIIAFKEAPPLNRLRILTLFSVFAALCAVVGYDGSSTTGLVLNAIGLLVGRLLDFAGSPIALFLAQAPADTPAAILDKARNLSGLAIVITALSAILFAVLVRFRHWPNRDRAFSVWINLPNFDPTSGGDVVTRLLRDGRISILAAMLAPFVFPVVAGVCARQVGFDPFASYHAIVWGIGVWMFVPLSLFMRGLAMMRLARMIRTRRARLVADLHVDAPRQLA